MKSPPGNGGDARLRQLTDLPGSVALAVEAACQCGSGGQPDDPGRTTRSWVLREWLGDMLTRLSRDGPDERLLAPAYRLAKQESGPPTVDDPGPDVATPTGLEPATSAVTGRRANRLRYGAS